MIAIIDYDAGNLKSVEKALVSLGEAPVITRQKDVIQSADKVILPGVGAFGDAMEKLHQYGLVDVIRQVAKSGTPLLGICLGLQLLFLSQARSRRELKGLVSAKEKFCGFPQRTGSRFRTWDGILCITIIRAGCFRALRRILTSISYIRIIWKRKMRRS